MEGGLKMFTKKVFTILMILMVLCTACGGSQASPKITPVSGDYNAKVDIGGRSLFLRCRGTGSPTVILEGNDGENVDTWTGVLLGISSFAHVCAYNRANLDGSDPAPRPRSAQDMAEDLHSLVSAAQIPGPYILVGHQIGAWNALVFAQKYPKEVAGLVLVEPLHPEEFTRALAALPAENSSEQINLRNCRAILEKSNTDSDPTSFMTGERSNFPESLAQVKKITSLGDLPLSVITTQGFYSVALWGQHDCCSPFASTLDPLHQQNNKEFLTLSTQSKETVSEYADDSTILNTWSSEVTNAVKEMVEAVK
jgi:pimeloyl-ACP methyl ester carboxylesterase